MTAELRQHIRTQIDRIVREQADDRPMVVAFCDRCGQAFDVRKTSRRTMCGCPTRQVPAEPKPRKPRLSTQELRQRARARRLTPEGRAAHTRYQARWRQRRRMAAGRA